MFYPVENGLLGEARTFSPDGNVLDNSCLSVNEQGVAKWVLKNNKHAGATTDTLSDGKMPLSCCPDYGQSVRCGGNRHWPTASGCF